MPTAAEDWLHEWVAAEYPQPFSVAAVVGVLFFSLRVVMGFGQK